MQDCVLWRRIASRWFLNISSETDSTTSPGYLFQWGTWLIRKTHPSYKLFLNQAWQGGTQRCLWGPLKALSFSQDGLLSRRHSECLSHSQQAEESLLIYENSPEKEKAKLSWSVWFLLEHLQLALMMMPTGVSEGCQPAKIAHPCDGGCRHANHSNSYLGLLWLMARDTSDWAGMNHNVGWWYEGLHICFPGVIPLLARSTRQMVGNCHPSVYDGKEYLAWQNEKVWATDRQWLCNWIQSRKWSCRPLARAGPFCFIPNLINFFWLTPMRERRESVPIATRL